eukprot:365655-Chlamydomonas_euryale.AAC.6
MYTWWTMRCSQWSVSPVGKTFNRQPKGSPLLPAQGEPSAASPRGALCCQPETEPQVNSLKGSPNAGSGRSPQPPVREGAPNHQPRTEPSAAFARGSPSTRSSGGTPQAQARRRCCRRHAAVGARGAAAAGDAGVRDQARVARDAVGGHQERGGEGAQQGGAPGSAPPCEWLRECLLASGSGVEGLAVLGQKRAHVSRGGRGGGGAALDAMRSLRSRASP